MNRKQRRQLNKVAGKQATSTIDLMLGMPIECIKCSKAYDKTSREMASAGRQVLVVRDFKNG